jgi:hypothetical protein
MTVCQDFSAPGALALRVFASTQRARPCARLIYGESEDHLHITVKSPHLKLEAVYPLFDQGKSRDLEYASLWYRSDYSILGTSLKGHTGEEAGGEMAVAR